MPDLGNKYECAECGTKFYDLGKAEPLCPKCGTDARLHQETRKHASEPRARYVAPVAAPAPAAEEVDDEVVDDIAEDDEEILEVEPGEVEDDDDDDED